MQATGSMTSPVTDAQNPDLSPEKQAVHLESNADDKAFHHAVKAIADPDPCHTPFFRVCIHFGMSSEAPSAWAMMYVRPEIICVLYFTSSVGGIVIFAVLYISGFPWFTRQAHIPVLIFISSQMIRQCGFWRHGPQFATMHSNKVLLPFTVGSLLFMIILAFAGPISYVPYRSRITTLITMSAAAFLISVSAVCGSIAADHPPQPHKSLLAPITNACFSALRIMDALTDWGFVRILATQVCLCHTSVCYGSTECGSL